jgi:hypothetical protein
MDHIYKSSLLYNLTPYIFFVIEKDDWVTILVHRKVILGGIPLPVTSRIGVGWENVVVLGVLEVGLE